MTKRKLLEFLPLSNAAALGIFALLTMSLVFAVYVLTLEPIAHGQAEYERKILLELGAPLGDADYPSALEFRPKDAGDYDILKNGEKVGTIVAAETDDGYSGRIQMLASIANNGTLIALRVTQHSETPGLGDKIDREKSDWILQFNHRGSDTNWQLRHNGGDFDGLTGATITSQAMVDAAARIMQGVK